MLQTRGRSAWPQRVAADADAGRARGRSPTYCGVGVRAEHSVLSDDAVQLERGQPGHKDHGG